MDARTCLVALLLLAPLAGCIVPQQEEVDPTPAGRYVPPAPPTEARIEGMTSEESKEDKVEPCASGGTLILPRTCATRDLLVTGRIGLDRLPVEISGTNGAIELKAGNGDAWSLHALVKVSAATEKDARRALDTAWAWSHTDGSSHFLKAGPTSPGGVATDPPGAALVGARYTLTLPAWVVVDATLRTSNGHIEVLDLATTRVDAETTNGHIHVNGAAQDLHLDTSNGRIVADVLPTSSGTFDFTTSNGRIEVALEEGARHGYDVDARTSNGQITLELSDGSLIEDERDHKAFVTSRFDEREIQTTVHLKTSNGRITVTG